MNKKNFKVWFLVLIILSVLSFKSSEKVSIWMIGDSTMANKKAETTPETGWGMVLQQFFTEGVVVHNHAVNGRSSKSFFSEGLWKSVRDSLKQGDYVIIQFGHNDEKADSIRHTDPFTTYKQLLKMYIDEARAKGAIPIVCSPIVRRHFDGSGNLKDTHGNYIKASREIALETNTPFVDMEAKTRKLVSESGPEKSKAIFLFCKPGEYQNRPAGVQDSTHLNREGARLVAGLFVTGMKELKSPLMVLAIPNLQNTVPSDTSFTTYHAWMQIKSSFPNATIVKPSLPSGVMAEKDLVYATLPDTPYGKRDLHLDIFRPEKSGKYPGVIIIHGGGWNSGNRSQHIPLAQQLAAKGFAAATVEYRLTPEARYPAAVYDIKASIRWMRANAEKYNIDPDHIAILGFSAGGQLAALVGMTNGIEKFEGDQSNKSFSSNVQAIVDIDGILDFLAPWTINLNRKPESADIMWLGGSFEEKPSTWKEASAIFWVNEKSVPILFINSALPRFHAGRDEMIDMMNHLNIYSEVHNIPDTPHPFCLFHPWFEQTVEYAGAFLIKVFK